MKVYCATRKSLASMSDLEVLQYIKGKDLWVRTNGILDSAYIKVLDGYYAFQFPDIVIYSVSTFLVESDAKSTLWDTPYARDAQLIKLARPIDTMTTQEIEDRVKPT